MQTTMRVYRPGSSEYEGQSVELDAEPTYAALCEVIEPLLDGARFEHVTVLFANQRSDMFVDEMGLIKRKPRNDRATEIYRAATLKRSPAIDPESLAFIAGVAVVFERRVWF